ncbi:MAG: hypothetical protein RH917_01655 [Lacipirellulaceae bacterium]
MTPIIDRHEQETQGLELFSRLAVELLKRTPKHEGGWGRAQRAPRLENIWGLAALVPSHPLAF